MEHANIESGRIDLAKKMLAVNISFQEIMDMTAYTLEELKTLKHEVDIEMIEAEMSKMIDEESQDICLESSHEESEL